MSSPANTKEVLHRNRTSKQGLVRAPLRAFARHDWLNLLKLSCLFELIYIAKTDNINGLQG